MPCRTICRWRQTARRALFASGSAHHTAACSAAYGYGWVIMRTVVAAVLDGGTRLDLDVALRLRLDSLRWVCVHAKIRSPAGTVVLVQHTVPLNTLAGCTLCLHTPYGIVHRITLYALPVWCAGRGIFWLACHGWDADDLCGGSCYALESAAHLLRLLLVIFGGWATHTTGTVTCPAYILLNCLALFFRTLAERVGLDGRRNSGHATILFPVLLSFCALPCHAAFFKACKTRRCGGTSAEPSPSGFHFLIYFPVLHTACSLKTSTDIFFFLLKGGRGTERSGASMALRERAGSGGALRQTGISAFCPLRLLYLCAAERLCQYFCHSFCQLLFLPLAFAVNSGTDGTWRRAKRQAAIRHGVLNDICLSTYSGGHPWRRSVRRHIADVYPKLYLFIIRTRRCCSQHL